MDYHGVIATSVITQIQLVIDYWLSWMPQVTKQSKAKNKIKIFLDATG